jgi:hypothetical protein
MLGIDNAINFIYNVELDSHKMGFKEFDINDEEEIIDSILNRLDNNVLIKLNEDKPLYVSLSKLFFSKIKKLESIEYENLKHISIINREDL